MPDRPVRVALFGGSFNPPHLAHQLACFLVLETEPVDALWMIPTFRHAFDKPLAPFEDRLEMCRRVARALGDRVRVLDIERELDQARSRTYDTLVELGLRYPDTAFRLVVGEDILAERHAWYRWDDVAALAPPIVLARAGANGAGEAGAGGMPRIELPAVSSTEIRERVARGNGAVPLVSRSVMDYIAERGLYR